MNQYEAVSAVQDYIRDYHGNLPNSDEIAEMLRCSRRAASMALLRAFRNRRLHRVEEEAVPGYMEYLYDITERGQTWLEMVTDGEIEDGYYADWED
jgi:hypothetical protein